eukprot:COSAG01_NODE_842_length_13174_cov_44.463250_11_plen_95_part_00
MGARGGTAHQHGTGADNTHQAMIVNLLTHTHQAMMSEMHAIAQRQLLPPPPAGERVGAAMRAVPAHVVPEVWAGCMRLRPAACFADRVRAAAAC